MPDVAGGAFHEETGALADGLVRDDLDLRLELAPLMLVARGAYLRQSRRRQQRQPSIERIGLAFGSHIALTMNHPRQTTVSADCHFAFHGTSAPAPNSSSITAISSGSVRCVMELKIAGRGQDRDAKAERGRAPLMLEARGPHERQARERRGRIENLEGQMAALGVSGAAH